MLIHSTEARNIEGLICQYFHNLNGLYYLRVTQLVLDNQFTRLCSRLISISSASLGSRQAQIIQITMVY